MEYVELGNGGPRVSRVGFGCAAIGGYDYGAVDDATSRDAIHAALDSGITLFDAADVYGLGHAEQVLGDAIAAARPSEIVLATKVGVRWDDAGRTRRDLSPSWIRRAAEGSLRRLRVECIDLYQLHWPDPVTPIADSMEAMLSLRAEGKIRHIGCCNFDVSLVSEAARHGALASNQLPYNVAERSSEGAVQVCWTQLGVATLAYNVLGHGLFSGKFAPGASFHGTDLRRRSPLFADTVLPSYLQLVERIREVGARCGRTPAQVAIRWALDQSGVGVALTGAKRAAQIRENAGGCDWSLPAQERHALDGTYALLRHQTATR